MVQKLNQKGFTLVEGLLIGVIVLLIGGIGAYVLHARNGDTKQSAVSQEGRLADSETDDTKAKRAAAPIGDEKGFQLFLLHTCSGNESPAINAMFENKDKQTVETDNFQLESGYAIANIYCNIDNVPVTTIFAKFENNKWGEVVNPGGDDQCGFLTARGFPDKVKAQYCQNQ